MKATSEMTNFNFYNGTGKRKRYWISWDLQKLSLLENNPNNARNNLKSHFKNKKTKLLNKIISHQFLGILLEGENHEQLLQND